MLVDAGAKLEHSTNKHGCTAFHLAAGGGHFVGESADWGWRQYGSLEQIWQHSVLHLAAQSGDSVGVEQLVTAGANTTRLDNG